MSASLVLFYVYALVAIAGALGLVAARSLVHAVMSLFATLIAVAALFLLLGSQFLAAMQLFVYGGAITVLVLFVLMLTGAAPRGRCEVVHSGPADSSSWSVSASSRFSRSRS